MKNIRSVKIDSATIVKCHTASFSGHDGEVNTTLKVNPRTKAQCFTSIVGGAGDGVVMLSLGGRLHTADSFLSGSTLLCSHLPSQAITSATGLSVVCVSTDESSGPMAGFVQRLPRLSNDHLRESKAPASVGHVLGDECIQQCVVPLKHTRKTACPPSGKHKQKTKKRVSFKAHCSYHSIVAVSDLLPASTESLKLSTISAVRGGGIELAPFMEIRLNANCADLVAPILLQDPSLRRGWDSTQYLSTLQTFVEKRLSCKCCSKTILKANLLPQPSSLIVTDGADWCLSCGFPITQRSTCRPASTTSSTTSNTTNTTATTPTSEDVIVHGNTIMSSTASITTSVPFPADLLAIASLVNTLYNFTDVDEEGGAMGGDGGVLSHLPHCSCLICAPKTLARRQQYDEPHIASMVAEEDDVDDDDDIPVDIPVHLIAFLALHECWNNIDSASSSSLPISTAS